MKESRKPEEIIQGSSNCQGGSCKVTVAEWRIHWVICDVPPLLGGGMATSFISNTAEDHGHLQKSLFSFTAPIRRKPGLRGPAAACKWGPPGKREASQLQQPWLGWWLPFQPLRYPAGAAEQMCSLLAHVWMGLSGQRREMMLPFDSVFLLPVVLVFLQSFPRCSSRAQSVCVGGVYKGCLCAEYVERVCVMCVEGVCGVCEGMYWWCVWRVCV